MNKLIGFLLITVSLNANAEAWFTKNEAGGEIIITDNVCYFNGKQFTALKEGYTRNPSGEVLHGCWYYDNGTIHMTYENKNQYAYPVNYFSKMTVY